MIALISHDAGGAEILSSYARRQVQDFLFALGPPAQKIFERKLGSIDVIPVDDAIDKSTSILCGTSWQSDLELNAIARARSSGKPSIAFLDHWVNYRERFMRSGISTLPDEIWVGDITAEAMAKTAFPNICVTLVNNPYVLDVQQELEEIKSKREPNPDALSVLYVCEPIGDHALTRHGDRRYWGYVEEDALRYFLANISALDKSVERVLVRPHPSEAAEKYTWVQSEFDIPIEIGGSKTLLQEIVDCDYVVGCESMAMVIALLAGKEVLSCIPPGGRACVLPYQEIVCLQDIVETSSH